MNRLTTPENVFVFTEDAKPFIDELFRRGLIWYCVKCNEWHITEAGEELGVESSLLESFAMDASELPTDAEALELLRELKGDDGS